MIKLLIEVQLVSSLRKERQQELDRTLLHNELSELILENKSKLKNKGAQDFLGSSAVLTNPKLNDGDKVRLGILH